MKMQSVKKKKTCSTAAETEHDDLSSENGTSKILHIFLSAWDKNSQNSNVSTLLSGFTLLNKVFLSQSCENDMPTIKNVN